MGGEWRVREEGRREGATEVTGGGQGVEKGRGTEVNLRTSPNKILTLPPPQISKPPL